MKNNKYIYIVILNYILTGNTPVVSNYDVEATEAPDVAADVL